MSLFSRFIVLIVLLVANPGLPVVAQAQAAPARLTCRIDPSPLALNGQATLLIEIANVQNLYGYDLSMTYDAARVQVEDGNAEKPGTNLALGDFVSPDFVVVNSAEHGTIRLALTQLAPAGPKSGTGELAWATLVGLSAGFANFAFVEVTLSDANGQVIAVTTQDCLVEVGAAGQPTPTATHTPEPTPAATPIATDTPAPTSAPPTSTFTPLPPAPTATPADPPVPSQATTSTPVPTETATATATVVIITTPTPSLSSSSEMGLRADNNQQQSALATATPTPLAQIAPSPTPAQMALSAATTAPTQTPFSDGAAPPAEPLMPALGQEVLSPPQIEVDAVEINPESEMDEITTRSEIGNPIAVQEPVRAPTPTAPPLAIARGGQAALPAVEVVQQPQSPAFLFQRNYLQELGWLFLLLTVALAIAAWRLRRA